MGACFFKDLDVVDDSSGMIDLLPRPLEAASDRASAWRHLVMCSHDELHELWSEWEEAISTAMFEIAAGK